MKTLLVVAALLVAVTATAGTRDNDDTCDIKVGPAATLLLPYFEVDLGQCGRPDDAVHRHEHPSYDVVNGDDQYDRLSAVSRS